MRLSVSWRRSAGSMLLNGASTCKRQLSVMQILYAVKYVRKSRSISSALIQNVSVFSWRLKRTVDAGPTVLSTTVDCFIHWTSSSETLVAVCVVTCECVERPWHTACQLLIGEGGGCHCPRQVGYDVSRQISMKQTTAFWIDYGFWKRLSDSLYIQLH